MAAARKRLTRLLMDGTFLARRHGARLEAEALPEQPPSWADEEAWEWLRELQQAYRQSTDAAERRLLALELQRGQRTLRREFPILLAQALAQPAPLAPATGRAPAHTRVELDGAELRQRFGELLREEREAAGLTQAELERRCGFGHGRVSALERGSRNPTLVAIGALAQALGRRPADLLARL